MRAGDGEARNPEFETLAPIMGEPVMSRTSAFETYNPPLSGVPAVGTTLPSFCILRWP
jgi:hypothetical protein